MQLWYCLFLLSLVLRATALLSKGVIFPLYIYPDLVFNDGCAAWTPLINAITSNPSLPFLIVINPNSGPGDPNTQPDSNYRTCIVKLLSSGAAQHNVKTIGYIRTGFGSRSSADVFADIATYAQWNAAYRPTGIFFDETDATASFISLYQSYASRVRQAVGSSAFVTFNPGTTPDTSFFAFSDLIVTAENFFSQFSASQLVINTSSPAQKQSVILHTGPTTPSSSLINQLVGQIGIPYTFMTNFPNATAYTNIPTNWAQFVSDVIAAQS